MRPVCTGALVHYEQTVRTLPEIAIVTWTPETGMVPSSIAPSVPSMLSVSPSVPQGLTRTHHCLLAVYRTHSPHPPPWTDTASPLFQLNCQPSQLWQLWIHLGNH